MDTFKSLDNFIKDNSSVYFKSFDNVQKEEKVSKNDIIGKIKTVFDPEIPVNIYDLGLVYKISIDNKNVLKI